MADNNLEFSIDGAKNMDVFDGFHGSFETNPGLILKDSKTWTVLGEHGEMAFSCVGSRFWTIWLNKYRIVRDARLSSESSHSSLEAIHMLQGDISFSPVGLKEPLSMRGGDWQMIYLPSSENKVFFPAGTNLVTLDIHFHPTYLEMLAPFYAHLDKLLEQVVKQRPTQISSSSLPIPSKVKMLVGELFMVDSSASGQRLLLERNMIDWIACEMDSPHFYEPRSKLKEVDRLRVMEVIEFIFSATGKQLRVEELARRATMNEYSFQYAFRCVTGRTVHRFIVEERMKNGMFLLTNTHLPLDDIAAECGYETYAGFSREFKKHYGMAPSWFRRQ